MIRVLECLKVYGTEEGRHRQLEWSAGSGSDEVTSVLTAEEIAAAAAAVTTTVTTGANATLATR